MSTHELHGKVIYVQSGGGLGLFGMGVQFGEMGAEQPLRNRHVACVNSPGIVGKFLEKTPNCKIRIKSNKSMAHVEIRRATETTWKMPE